VKHADLVRHLEANGCVLLREGGKDTVYYNPKTQRTSTVPRHREIKNPTAVRICKQLMVPDPLR
jgi:predicted RNA binding protein YcfA (HicA-like mRNA interferase family)